MQTNRKIDRRAKPKRRPANPDVSVPRQMGVAAGPGAITTRVLAIEGDLATNALGYLPAASAFSSANAFSAPDFASLANLFVSYRVLSMEVVFMPITVVNTTATPEVGCFASCLWNSGTSPSTYQQIVEGANFTPRNGRKILKISASNRQLQNQMFTGITAPVTGTDTFGIAYGAPQRGRQATVSTQWCRYVQRLLVELEYAG